MGSTQKADYLSHQTTLSVSSTECVVSIQVYSLVMQESSGRIDCSGSQVHRVWHEG